MGFLPVVFSLLYLESYLGLSEETRSPNEGLRTGGIRNPNLAFRCTEARTSPKARRVAAPSVQPSGASSWPPARLGPWAAQGRWLGEGRMLSGPAEELPRLGGGGSHSLPAPPTTATLASGSPCAYTPGGRKFPPPSAFFPPWSSAGARASAALRVQTREAPAAAAAAGAEPSVPGTRAPLPSPARPHAASRTLGPRRRILVALAWLLPPAARLWPRSDAQRAWGREWAQEG